MERRHLHVLLTFLCHRERGHHVGLEWENGAQLFVGIVPNHHDYPSNDPKTRPRHNHPPTNDPHTVYGYDATQQISKDVYTDATLATLIEKTDYEYNLQGRISAVELDADGNDKAEIRLDYEYDDSGVRVAQTKTTDGGGNGQFNDPDDTAERTDYLVDHRNHTGYAQVLEEWVDGTLAKSYTIGHDVFAETIAANDTRHLLKDGHGSTRQLVDALGNVIDSSGTAQIFAYDAYGLPVGFDFATALTTLLYNSEQLDKFTGLQYLRARYYDMATGRFNRLDPFAGNMSDPQSLHKYLYTHGDPINRMDPTGYYSVGQLGVAMAIGAAIGGFGTGALFAGAGKNPVHGFLSGALGGGALVFAYYRGILGQVVMEAMAATALVAVVDMVHDVCIPPDPEKQWIEYVADAAEAFMWGAFYGAFAHYEGWPTVKTEGDIITLAAVEGFFEGGAAGFATLMTFAEILVGAIGGYTDAAEHFKSYLKDDIVRMFDVAIGSVGSLAVLTFDEVRFIELPVFRVISSRQRGNIAVSLVDIGVYLATGAVGGVSLEAFVSNKAENVAGGIVDLVYRIFEPR